MQYFLTFIEGIITFISPCLLPMLPIYISYFAGDNDDNNMKLRRSKIIKNTLGFILGFTIIFMALGTIAGLVGSLLINKQAVNIITGSIIVLFGFNYLGIINIDFLNNVSNRENKKVTGFLSSVVFGIVFSITWTPCVGAFLGSALAVASNQDTAFKGTLLLLSYSLGLAIPFLFCAILIEQLKLSFDFIKKNYKVITMFSGIFLIIIGILIMTGTIGRFLALTSF